MDVFKIIRQRERILIDLPLYPIQPGQNLPKLIIGQNTDLVERPSLHPASLDIDSIETPIEPDRSIEPLHQLCRRPFEPTRPGLVATFAHSSASPASAWFLSTVICLLFPVFDRPPTCANPKTGRTAVCPYAHGIAWFLSTVYYPPSTVFLALKPVQKALLNLPRGMIRLRRHTQNIQEALGVTVVVVTDRLH